MHSPGSLSEDGPGTQRQDRRLHEPFSRRTPLNFFALFFTAINSPDVLSRLVHAGLPITFDLSCVRFFTTPLRALSPAGLFTAMMISFAVGINRNLADFFSLIV